MPMFEFVCPICLDKLERFTFGNITAANPVCKRCDQGVEMKQVEFSLPAKRNPEHGLQK